MAKIVFGGQLYDTDLQIDTQAIIDKIKAAQNGEDVPGVTVFHLPETQDKNDDDDTTKLPVTSLLLAGLGIVLIKPAKK